MGRQNAETGRKRETGGRLKDARTVKEGEREGFERREGRRGDSKRKWRKVGIELHQQSGLNVGLPGEDC